MQLKVLCALMVAFGVILEAGSGRPPLEDDEAQAWLNCTPLIRTTDIWQKSDSNGQPRNALGAYFDTGTENITQCVHEFRIDGKIDEFDHHVGGNWSNPVTWAEVINYPVEQAGTFHATGHHFAKFLGFQRDLGKTHDEVEMEDECLYTNECEFPSEPGSPLVIDLDQNGFHFSGSEDRVFFDIDADGQGEWINWTAYGSGDAFLALDRNGNGRIDDGSELFGNHTPVYFTGQPGTTANGFEVLRFFESPLSGLSSDYNNEITAADEGFRRLLLWVDANHNGISEPSELQSAPAAGLRQIGLDYRENRRRDQHGNELRQQGTSVWFLDGRERSLKIVDVWFVVE